MRVNYARFVPARLLLGYGPPDHFTPSPLFSTIHDRVNSTENSPPHTQRGVNFRVTILPSTIQLGMYVVLQGSRAEAHDGAEHRLAMEILGPDRSRIGQPLNTPFKVVQLGSATPEGWVESAAFTTVVRIPVDAPGTHTIEIRVDGDTPHSVPVGIRTGPLRG